MSSSRRNAQLAFLLGFGVSFLPAFGPFVGLLFVLTTRLRPRVGDLPWFAAALATCAAVSATSGAEGALFGLLQVIGPWAIYRAFGELHESNLAQFSRTHVLRGLFVGFVLLVAIGLGRVSLNLNYPTVAGALVWGTNPALFAHTLLVVGGLIAILTRQAWMRACTLAASAAGILAAGSREAAFGLLLVLGYLAVRATVTRRRNQALTLAIVFGSVLLLVVSGPTIGLGNIGYLVSATSTSRPTNLIRGSEIATGDWWIASDVNVKATKADFGGRTRTVYTVKKEGSAGWLRLQEVVSLERMQTYTVSAWVLDNGAQHSGIQGWGQPDANSKFALTAELVGGRVHAALQGSGVIERFGVAARSGAWKRIYATFEYRGASPRVDWYVGLAPDGRAVAGTAASFAGFQVERGPLTDYKPGTDDRGLPFAEGRLRMWRVAWAGFLKRPWLGQGVGAFPTYYEHTGPSASEAGSEVPAHAHSLFLEILFERGVVGLVGLLLLLSGMALSALRRSDGGFLVVLAAILLANVFDYTFFSGGIIYPLAAVAGWRAGTGSEGKTAADSVSKQFVVRLLLASLDFCLAWLAFVASTHILAVIGIHPDQSPRNVLGLSRYALLLWPALAWREGLYPGYGLTEPDELKRQVWGATYAGILFLTGSVLFRAEIGVAPALVLVQALLTLFLLPIGRGTAKRILRELGIWGRPVVILGTGTVASNIAQTLIDRSLDGLRPVAMFGAPASSEATQAELRGKVPYLGPISAANAFARREGIHHAIVAMDPNSPTLHLPKLDPAEDAFTLVQYVPDLPGLPVLGVRAGSLDNLLALEVRNELASPVNRFAKRLLDLVATVVGGLVISPLLLVLAAAIAIDSRGPVFFGHTRIGRNGRKIRVWKFRTMVKDAAEALERHLEENPELRAEWQANHKLKHDPRVTRVGRFLRRFSLDELPQLWNVLKGEMSLVGPRPIVDDEVGKYADAFDLYTMVRPGMTGYWQISGRSDTDYDQRVELDSFYVRNWSVWLDIVVLIKTVAAVLKREGAY